MHQFCQAILLISSITNTKSGEGLREVNDHKIEHTRAIFKVRSVFE